MDIFSIQKKELEMKFRYAHLALCVAAVSAIQVQALDVLGAVADSAGAISQATNEINELIKKVAASVVGVQQRVGVFSRSFEAIAKTSQPQVIVNSTFNAIDSALDFPTIMMPLLQELTGVVSIISNKLLPAISRFPGVPAEINKARFEINNILAVVDRIRTEIVNWTPKIKELSRSIGGHVSGITREVESTVNDIKQAL
jgi:hypothetical protein